MKSYFLIYYKLQYSFEILQYNSFVGVKKYSQFERHVIFNTRVQILNV